MADKHQARYTLIRDNEGNKWRVWDSQELCAVAWFRDEADALEYVRWLNEQESK